MQARLKLADYEDEVLSTWLTRMQDKLYVRSIFTYLGGRRKALPVTGCRDAWKLDIAYPGAGITGEALLPPPKVSQSAAIWKILLFTPGHSILTSLSNLIFILVPTILLGR